MSKVTVLTERTAQEFGYDPAALPPTSDRRVWVVCHQCRESFLRPYLEARRPHDCPAGALGVLRHRLRGVLRRLRSKPPYRLECRLIHPLAKLPTKARRGDAGHDIYSVEGVEIPAGGNAMVHTGIQLAAPLGVYYTIEGRSSLWSRQITPCRGIIDPGYTGEVIVALVNTGVESYWVRPGDRIAQIIIHETLHCDITPVQQFSPDYSERGDNGFGSSGR